MSLKQLFEGMSLQQLLYCISLQQLLKGMSLQQLLDEMSLEHLLEVMSLEHLLEGMSLNQLFPSLLAKNGGAGQEGGERKRQGESGQYLGADLMLPKIKCNFCFQKCLYGPEINIETK